MNHPLLTRGYQELSSLFRATLIRFQDYLEISIELKKEELEEIRLKREYRKEAMEKFVKSEV